MKTTSSPTIETRDKMDLPTILNDPRTFLFNYYTEIGHSEAVEDLVALLPDEVVRKQAMVLAMQDWAADNLDEQGYEDVVAILGIMYND